MVAIKNLFFLITAASALVFPRNAAQIQADLRLINDDTNALRAAADRFTGGLFGALPVQNAASRLEDRIATATANANASPVLSDAEAAAIIAYITNTLSPNVELALTSIENKRTQFNSAGTGGLVRSTLASLRSATNTYGQALLAKAPASAQAPGQAILAEIDQNFADTQAFFA